MNLEWLIMLLPFCFFIGMADDSGGDDKGDKGNKGGDGDQDKGLDTVSKADYEKALSDLSTLKEELEDARMEVMTPEYLSFLDQKEKGKDKEPDDKLPADDELENLPKKKILELAEERAIKKMQKEINELKSGFESSSKAERAREVAAFARQHDDFETYKPIMYGLSLDKKNADLGLSELYEKAKKHVKELNTEPTEDEKNKQRKQKGEKPGGSSASTEKDKKYTPEQAADEAWEEVVGDGELPPAV